jgi:hypothetical protein
VYCKSTIFCRLPCLPTFSDICKVQRDKNRHIDDVFYRVDDVNGDHVVVLPGKMFRLMVDSHVNVIMHLNVVIILTSANGLPGVLRRISTGTL